MALKTQRKSITLFVQRLDLSGGKTTMLFKMAELFVEAGFDVTVCAFWQQRPTWWLRFRTVFPLPRGVRFTYIFKAQRSNRKEFDPIHAEKRNPPERLQEFKDFCKTIKTDAIYLPNFGQFIETAILENVPSHVFKILGDHHGPRYKLIDAMETPSELSENYKKFYSWAKDFDAMHIVNPVIEQPVKQFFKNEIISIPNFIDPQPRPQKSFLKSRTIVAGGRLVAEKRFDDLLEAFGACRAQFPNWTLEIYGRGPELGKLNKIIAANNMQGAATVLSPSRHFRAKLAQAALHISSSESESFGLTLAEAMSFGVPVLSQFDHAGYKFLLSEGRGACASTPDVNGLTALMLNHMQLIEEGDPEGILVRRTENAYDFAQQVFFDRVIKSWRDAIDAGVDAKAN